MPPDGSADVTVNFYPYDGWEVSDIVIDGLYYTPDSATKRRYTFKNVNANHTIWVTAFKLNSDQTAPANKASVQKLIDYLANGTPLDGNYDYNGDGTVDGMDLLILRSMI